MPYMYIDATASLAALSRFLRHERDEAVEASLLVVPRPQSPRRALLEGKPALELGLLGREQSGAPQ